MSGDVVVTPHGTLVLFDLLTRAAERWVEDKVQWDAQWFGSSLVVEHRFAADLAQGMSDDGLRVQLARVGVC